jgi:hypothetical protein
MISGFPSSMVELRETQGVMNKVTRKHGGMPDWALLGIGLQDRRPVLYWPYWSNVDGERFLTRFIIIFTPLGGIHVTRVHTADNARLYPHDHSRSFISFKLGWYNEWVYYNPQDLSQRRLRTHGRFSFHLMRYNMAHSITQVSPKLVTVLFLGRKKQKSNYWTALGKRTIGMKIDQK